jgi:hypothetical protein
MKSSPLRSEWRWPTAVLLLEIAVIHITLIPAHLREAPYAGALFIALSTTALLLAGLMLVRDQALVWAAAGALSVGAIVAYVASRSIGLPMLSDDLHDWLKPLGVGAVFAEVLVTGISLLVLRRVRRGDPQRRGPGSRVRPLATGRA